MYLDFSATATKLHSAANYRLSSTPPPKNICSYRVNGCAYICFYEFKNVIFMLHLLHPHLLNQHTSFIIYLLFAFCNKGVKIYYLKKGELHDVHTSCSSKMRKRIKLSYPILKLFITHTDIVIIFQHDIKSRLDHLSIHISMVC